MHDIIVVGSGPAGVNVAFPLCEAGINVIMLDYGNSDEKYDELIPAKNFLDIRKSDEKQHRYFLGDNFEGILLDNIRVGTKLTPPRLHVLADSSKLMPVDSGTFVANESLAIGGLAASWGAGAIPFHKNDFSNMPFTLEELLPHYNAVAKRIGISGSIEDFNDVFRFNLPLMPSIKIDSNAESVINRYNRKKSHFTRNGFYLMSPTMAICTEPFRGRMAHQYLDMDFWSDNDNSVYRPKYTLDELLKFDNFIYQKNRFVLSFEETGSNKVGVKVMIRDSSKEETYTARALVLAAGAMSTVRIVLRSLNKYDVKVPILTNAYTYIPSINLNMIGKIPRDKRCSLTQLHLYYFPEGNESAPVLSSLFSYRSLLLFKLLKEAPLPQKECLDIMRSLVNLFAIITIFHEDAPSDNKYCMLQKTYNNGYDRLLINYYNSDSEIIKMRDTEKTIKKFYRTLRCFPLKTIRRTPGSSIHYSGTLPMSSNNQDLTCDKSGRLFGTKSVYVADGSLISPLPSIALTFTIMALADRIGTMLAGKMKK